MQSLTDIRGLSLHQPWATNVRDGLKTIETRMWSTHYRGTLLICSTQKPYVPSHAHGVALCIADLVDCRPMTEADEPEALCEWEPGRIAWLLGAVFPIVPIAVRGRQGLWRVPADVIDRIKVAPAFAARPRPATQIGG